MMPGRCMGLSACVCLTRAPAVFFFFGVYANPLPRSRPQGKCTDVGFALITTAEECGVAAGKLNWDKHGSSDNTPFIYRKSISAQGSRPKTVGLCARCLMLERYR